MTKCKSPESCPWCSTTCRFGDEPDEDKPKCPEGDAEKMRECTQCPHVIGDYTERDCSFPDCVGGWEVAFNALSAELDRRIAEAEERQQERILPAIQILQKASIGSCTCMQKSPAATHHIVDCRYRLIHDAMHLLSILNAGGSKDDERNK